MSILNTALQLSMDCLPEQKAQNVESLLDDLPWLGIVALGPRDILPVPKVVFGDLDESVAL